MSRYISLQLRLISSFHIIYLTSLQRELVKNIPSYKNVFYEYSCEYTRIHLLLNMTQMTTYLLVVTQAEPFKIPRKLLN